MYLIAHCYSCGNLLILQEGSKKKRCTYCNTHLSVSLMRVVAKVKSASEARILAMHLKRRQAEG